MNSLTRREMIAGCVVTGCGCLAGSTIANAQGRKMIASQNIGAITHKQSFGQIEKLGDGVYAFVSTPFTKDGKIGDMTTHSNGGLIAGKDGVLAFDAYRTPQGAAWVAQVSQELFGKRPTHIACSHFHFDHIGGLGGFFHEGDLPEIIMTQTTYQLALDHYAKVIASKNNPAYGQHALQPWGGSFVSPTKIVLNESETFTLDLGGCIVRFVPKRGHTGSDLAIEVDDPAITFGGDLIWNGIFPNFMSATPSLYRQSVEELLARKSAIVVAGHGPAAKADSIALTSYAELHALIEDKARAAYVSGIGLDAAVASFQIPDRLGYWKYFKPGFHKVAFRAWYKELSA
ncbi:MBL fold metallo-hydrolase [Poriferisphaera sp. WC338]|uniref:MBL fold metallo-hydrolase n=1 Tax=Poriferisphaera sp. WC338 TaxID=3425129 RepID=UPI003D81A1B2